MEATLVTGWEGLCQLLASAFTRPTTVTFLHLVTGWVLCRSQPTVTSLVCTIGRSLLGHAAKHWTTYERFFYRAAWSLSEVSGLLLVRVVAPLLHRPDGGRDGNHRAVRGALADRGVDSRRETARRPGASPGLVSPDGGSAGPHGLDRANPG